MELKPTNAGDITLETLQHTLADWERRFPRKTTAGMLSARAGTWDIVRSYFPVVSLSNPAFTPFNGLYCKPDETVPERMVRVLNLDGEVIQEITI